MLKIFIIPRYSDTQKPTKTAMIGCWSELRAESFGFRCPYKKKIRGHDKTENIIRQ
jgi:hypothetical protein